MSNSLGPEDLRRSKIGRRQPDTRFGVEHEAGDRERDPVRHAGVVIVQPAQSISA